MFTIQRQIDNGLGYFWRPWKDDEERPHWKDFCGTIFIPNHLTSDDEKREWINYQSWGGDPRTLPHNRKWRMENGCTLPEDKLMDEMEKSHIQHLNNEEEDDHDRISAGHFTFKPPLKAVLSPKSVDKSDDVFMTGITVAAPKKPSILNNFIFASTADDPFFVSNESVCSDNDDDPEEDKKNDSDKKISPQVDEVHIREQQRNGRKMITLIEGISNKVNIDVLLQRLKKELAVGGAIILSKSSLGRPSGEVHGTFLTGNQQTILQLSGNVKNQVRDWLIKNLYCEDQKIKVHG